MKKRFFAAATLAVAVSMGIGCGGSKPEPDVPMEPEPETAPTTSSTAVYDHAPPQATPAFDQALEGAGGADAGAPENSKVCVTVWNPEMEKICDVLNTPIPFQRHGQAIFRVREGATLRVLDGPAVVTDHGVRRGHSLRLMEKAPSKGTIVVKLEMEGKGRKIPFQVKLALQ